MAAHKSVAELGAIGRVEDMHQILDAEREATLAYLDSVTRDTGGRRGRARRPVATSGLIYAHTRPATSRAGDPSPHDHVLVANLVEMLDGPGRWKAADTSLWRDELHAATVVGRMAAARVAVELGYAIEVDDGPSGRLGLWRISGIPDEVLDVHSKRSAEIDAAVAARGKDSYQTRNDAARDTRAAKRHTPVGELMPRWRSELTAIGWDLARLNRSVETAAHQAALPRPASPAELDRVVAAVVSTDGPLARKKVFSAADVVVTVAPHLYGRPLDDLARATKAVLRSPELVPLLGVRGARDWRYTTARTLATEAAIADLVAWGAGTTGAAVVPPDVVESAIIQAAARLGRPLTTGQEGAVRGVCRDGRRVSLVLGVAGSGKTTGPAGGGRRLPGNRFRRRWHGDLRAGGPHSRP